MEILYFLDILTFKTGERAYELHKEKQKLDEYSWL